MSNLKEIFAKKEPEILCTVGIVGMIATVGLAIGGTIKAVKAVELAERKKQEEAEETVKKDAEEADIDVEKVETQPVKLTKLETAKTVYKYYIPAAILGVTSTCLLLRSKRLFAGRLVTVAAAYKLSEKNLMEYKDKVKDILGEKEEKKVNDALAQARTDENPPDENIQYTGNGETLCREELTGRYFRSNRQAIESAINDLNYRAMSEMWISANDFFDAIEIDEVQLGDDIGWDIERGQIQPVFSSALTNTGTPILTVDFRVCPGPRASHLR